MRQGPFDCESEDALLNLYRTIDKRFSLADLVHQNLGYALKQGLLMVFHLIIDAR
jgi:hypothetical protein